jgi:hypothetical protein
LELRPHHLEIHPVSGIMADRSVFPHEVIADNLSKAGWSWGYLSAIDSNGRTVWIVNLHAA